MLYFFTDSMVLFWFISYQTTNKYQAKQLIVCCVLLLYNQIL